MARVTVEDCVLEFPTGSSWYCLPRSARDILSGAPLTVDRDNDKGPVVALREIADVTIPLDTLQNNVIKSMQKHVEIDEPEEDHDVEIGARQAGLPIWRRLATARRTRSKTPPLKMCSRMPTKPRIGRRRSAQCVGRRG